jgi:hypothetical protein
MALPPCRGQCQDGVEPEAVVVWDASQFSCGIVCDGNGVCVTVRDGDWCARPWLQHLCG